MSGNKNKFFCGDCKKGWVRKVDCEKHFSLENIREGGKLIRNCCFNRKRKFIGESLQEAESLKRSKTLDRFGYNLPSRSVPDPEFITDTNISVSECVPFSNAASNLDLNPTTSTCATTISAEAGEVNEVTPTISDSNMKLINQKLDSVLNAVHDIPKQFKQIMHDSSGEQKSTDSSSFKSNKCDDMFEKHINELKQAVSMKSIKENVLIKNIFVIYKQTEDDTEFMKCQICSSWSNPNSAKSLGIHLVEGSEYSVFEKGIKHTMSQEFSNLKRTLIKHISCQTHQTSLKQEDDHNRKNKQLKKSISHSMRQMAYFTLKCKLPFNQFENYCATNVSCGLEIGNINHSRTFIQKYLSLINDELIKKTLDWFDEQTDITVTLDIGTECGVPLLAVLFISNKKSKLVDIVPVTSKKGVDIASACFEACQMKGFISKEKLKEKIVGVTGDGAFAKGNAPFKDTMELLFDKKLVFRWDLLHLINRAHIAAKGKIEDGEESEDEESDSESTSRQHESLVSELIKFIQSQARSLRHGIQFSKLQEITSGNFKRPKVWSQTRMVVYEFEMLERFLENSIYLDIPSKYIILAKCQCLVMFALKYLLKNLQRMDITPGYVKSVITNEAGKSAMALACQVSCDVYSDIKIDYLENDNVEADICFDREITFNQVLKKYVEDKKDLYIKKEDPNEKKY